MIANYLILVLASSLVVACIIVFDGTLQIRITLSRQWRRLSEQENPYAHAMPEFGTTKTVSPSGTTEANVEYYDQVAGRLTVLIDRRIAQASAYLKRTREGDKITNQQFLSHEFRHGRLGNWMFQAASLVGIARANGRVPITLKSQKLKSQLFEGFHLPLIGIEEFRTVSEIAAGKYNEATKNLSQVCQCNNQTLVLDGYLQSWKYFDKVRQDIRHMFTFRRGILNRAKKQILASVGKLNKRANNTVLVGIHVRRGDHLDAQFKAIGFLPATDDYLLRAAHYMSEKGESLFFVLTDDVPYCKALFPGKEFVIVEGNRPEVDMALLTMMDRVILTVGSFGWSASDCCVK